MKLIDKIKNSYNSYLEKLAKINQNEFGKDGLDCCDINKDK